MPDQGIQLTIILRLPANKLELHCDRDQHNILNHNFIGRN